MHWITHWNSQIRRSLIVCFILFCLSSVLVVGCNPQLAHRSSAQSPSSERVVLGTTAVIRTIDPADAYELFSGNLLYNLGDRLYTYAPGTTELVPQLATALPKISPDGLTYTIPLRQGVTFHDGTPFNAKAMAFSLDRFMQNGGAPVALLTDVVKSIQATAEYELTIQLQKPFVAFPSVLAFTGACAVSPNVYEIGKDKFKSDEFVGTGPYKLIHSGSDSMRLDVFDQYWGEKPANRGIDIQFFSSSANLFTAFKTGAVDAAYQNLDLDQVRSLQQGANQNGWQVIEGAGAGIYYLSLNLQSPPLDRIEVRQQLAALIDRPLLQKRVFQGQVEPLYSLIPTSLDAYKPVFQTPTETSQTTLVRAETAQINQPKAHSLMAERSDRDPLPPLSVDFWYRSNLTSNQLASVTLKASIQRSSEGAVQINLDGVESATAYSNLDKGVYPVFMLDWTPDFLDPDNYLQPFLSCTKGSPQKGCEEGASKLQGSFYYNDRINHLIDQERQEQNPQRRQGIFSEIQDILAQDVPFIPLWQSKEYFFAQKDISGVRLEPTQKVPFWTLKKG